MDEKGIEMTDTQLKNLRRKIIKIRGSIKHTIKNININSATHGRFLAISRYQEALRKNQIIHMAYMGTFWPPNCKDEYSCSINELKEWV